MNDWFVIDLGDALLADASLTDLEVQLLEIYKASGEPENMSAFYRHESQGLHCRMFVYLTPAFAEYAARLGAGRCKKPQASGLGLLFGSLDSVGD